MQLQAPSCNAPDFSPRSPRVIFPANACDSHAHILGPVAKFAYAPERVYTPPDCLLSDYIAMLKALRVSRAVLVQPSVYGTNNEVMMDALVSARADAKLTSGIELRGVAVVQWDIEFSQLQRMYDAGVRGVRVNVVDVKDKTGMLPLEQLKRLAQTIAPLGWHMEFLMHVDEYPRLDSDLKDFPVDVVFGHLGYMRTDKPVENAGFAAFLRLLKTGKAWVKLTGPYRISTNPMPHSDVAAFARLLLATAPDKIVWGSDWPHVMHKGPMPNDGDLTDLVSDWVPDEALRQRVLVENPAKLYGF